MSSGDVGIALQVYSNIDMILVPAYVLFHSYVLYGQMWSALFFVAFLTATLVFKFKILFVAIVFASYFISDLVINERILRTAPKTTRNYATLALTIILTVFSIMLATGAIEPYQGAIAFFIFYVFQARYRTSTLTMTQLAENAKSPQMINLSKKNMDMQ